MCDQLCYRGLGYLGLVEVRRRRVLVGLSEQQVLDETVEELVLVNRFNYLSNNCFNIVDCRRNNVGERGFPSSYLGRSKGDTCSFSCSESVEPDLMNTRLRSQGLGISVNYRTVADISRLKGGHCNNFQAGTSGEDVSKLRPSKLHYWYPSCHWHLMSDCNKIWNFLAGRLNVSVPVVIIVIVTVIYNLGSAEQIIISLRSTKPCSGAVLRIGGEKRVSIPGFRRPVSISVGTKTVNTPGVRG